MSMLRRFKPWLAQVRPEKKGCFEGWYFKFCTADGRSCALIPGISTNPADPHAFLQFIDGHSGRTAYFRYGLDDFSTNDKPFVIALGGCRFGESGAVVNAEQAGTARIRGQIDFGPWTPYPSAFMRPGIMGPFGLAGFLECYHGVVSAAHSIQGSLSIMLPDDFNLAWDFSNGRGYIEKDWGTSFPRDYAWLQANSFSRPDVSVFASLAAIPFGGMEFPGHIAFVHAKDLGGFVTFATWNGSRVRSLAVGPRSYEVVLERGRWRLEVQAHQTAVGALKAPAGGLMDRVIKESVDGELSFRLLERGSIVAEGSSSGAGLEQGGNPAALAQWFAGNKPPRKAP